jgi:uridine kinase
MRVKSPSKFTSLKLLLEIQTDNYIGKTGQEYVAEEVDNLIWKKQSENDQKMIENQLRQIEQRELVEIPF